MKRNYHDTYNNTAENIASNARDQCSLWQSYPSFRSFLKATVNRAGSSKAIFIVSLIYAKRFSLSHANFENKICCERCLYLGCLGLGQKYAGEKTMKNWMWGAWFSVSSYKVSFIEQEILKILNFKLHITPNEFYRWAALYRDMLTSKLAAFDIPDGLIILLHGYIDFQKVNFRKPQFSLPQEAD